jgi:Na+-transporting NADH:ubiquinone oxidoreductase subunit C
MKKQVLSVLFMFLIAFFFASLITAVKNFSNERIETNQAVKLQKIVLRVLDIPVEKKIPDDKLAERFISRIKDITVEGKRVYIGYEEDGRTIRGYAFPVGGPGFWGPIQGMAAVSPDAKKMLGLAFYRHGETPGLGGRITEDWFTEQFKDLPLYPIEGGAQIFYLTPEGAPKSKNELDAITGATNTSSAVEVFLNRELDSFLSELWDSIGERD